MTEIPIWVVRFFVLAVFMICDYLYTCAKKDDEDNIAGFFSLCCLAIFIYMLFWMP